MKNKFLETFNATLEEVLQTLEISPSIYQLAVQRYQAIGEWLDSGIDLELDIYPQGSFRLGTVVKPHGDSEGIEYDIDLVVQLPVPKENTTPQEIKEAIGRRLKENGRYKEMIGPEGRRCWKVEYSEKDGIAFHIDILPAVPQDLAKQLELENASVPHAYARTAIAITHRSQSGSYEWSDSNPRGFAQWFADINRPSFEKIAQAEKQRIIKTASNLYAAKEDVPDQLVRTPLQKAIQLLKRHRDVRFAGHDMEECKPITMIITTLAARIYSGEADVYSALSAIVRGFRSYTGLMSGGPDTGGPEIHVHRSSDGKWRIENPVDPGENFADRWDEDNNRRARAFFKWVEWLVEDLVDVTDEGGLIKTASLLMGSSKTAHYSSVNVIRKEVPHVEIKNPPRPFGCSPKRKV